MAGSQPSIRRWTTKHVARWLREEGFCDYVDLLCNKHRLDGLSLMALSEYDLRSPPLELQVLGDIKRLMVSLRRLQKQHVDVLEELGLTCDGHSLQGGGGGGSDWLCNGDSGRDYEGSPSNGGGADHQYHQCYQYSNGKHKQQGRRLDPEYWKTIVSSMYVMVVFGFTSFVMVIVHERVPDMRTYPPLPDIFLDRWGSPVIETPTLEDRTCHSVVLMWLSASVVDKANTPARVIWSDLVTPFIAFYIVSSTVENAMSSCIISCVTTV